jgi:two-component system cell cycle response regulator
MFNQEAFGEKLKNHRKLKNLTQEDVAEKIGVSGQAVSKWEKGECLPDCYNLKMLGKVYQISVDALLDVEEIATVDTLTGIFNQRHFLDYANILIDKARRDKENCYLIYFDIDFFKNINDTHGHDVGDKVLIEIAARIKSGIRASDFFARYGGEEFIIFMTGTDDAGVNKAAERLRLRLCDEIFDCGSVKLNVSASVGISKIIDFGMDKAIHNTMEKALHNADSAMYAAKKDGRNRVNYFEQ